jgi:hypothetical protein
MTFATHIRSRRSQRLFALISSAALMFSVMAVFAPPALAHNGTVTWGCDGWSVNLSNYSRGGTNEVTVTVDGSVVDSQSSNWASFSASGSWDDTQSHTLVVDVKAWDDPSQSSHTLGSNSSFSPDWQHGEWSFKLNITQDACTQPPPEEVMVTVGGVCVVEEGAGVGQISVDISVDDGASVEVSDSGGVIDTLTQSGTITVSENASYSWSASALPGFALTGSSSGTIDIEECTPPPVVGAAVTVAIASDCVVSDDLGQGVIDVTISVADGATVVITDSNGATMGTLTESGSITVPENAVYNWSATAADGFEFPAGAETSGTISIAECTPNVVGASILVTVGGTCVLDGNDGSGLITVTVSVADGATVVVSDSDGGIVGTFSSDGSVSVPEGATYSWLATANDGFEFPAGFDSSGTVTIETCSVATVLPFTGVFADQLATLGFILLASGALVMTGGWYLFGWNDES